MNKSINPFIFHFLNNGILSKVKENLNGKFDNLIIDNDILTCFFNEAQKYKVLIYDKWDNINNNFIEIFNNFIDITNKTINKYGKKELYVFILITKNYDDNFKQKILLENNNHIYDRFYHIDNFDKYKIIDEITDLIRKYPEKYIAHIKTMNKSYTD